jgi:hypothetical protein
MCALSGYEPGCGLFSSGDANTIGELRKWLFDNQIKLIHTHRAAVRGVAFYPL